MNQDEGEDEGEDGLPPLPTMPTLCLQHPLEAVQVKVELLGDEVGGRGSPCHSLLRCSGFL